MEFPHLAAADRGEPVRHDLPRALLLLLVADRRGACSPRTACALFDVEELPTHGGSLRIYGCHAEDDAQAGRATRCASCAAREERARARPTSTTYVAFGAARAAGQARAPRVPDRPQARGQAHRRLRRAGKGNTLLNYCGIGTDFLDYTVDRSPHKQGRFLPGTHIPIRAPEAIARDAARRRPHPALEPARRDHGAASVRPRVGRAVRRARARARAAAVRFTETPLAGAFVVELERSPTSAAASRARSTSTSSRRTASTPPSCSATRRSTRGAARCAACTTRPSPHGEAKLVRCTRGAIYDVVVDLRPDSPTYRRWFGAELSADNGAHALHPARARARLPDARGRLPRSTTRCRHHYVPEQARGVRWDDPAFGDRVAARRDPIVSERDRQYADFAP